jgi:methylated-DNA-[protein]-cysteine S-methyltransferase
MFYDSMDFTARYLSPIGNITMASDGMNLVGLWFDGQKYFADTLCLDHVSRPSLPVFQDTYRWLDTYFSGRDPHFTPRLLMRTTTFRRRVWNLLLSIPYGETVTYGDLARRLTAVPGLLASHHFERTLQSETPRNRLSAQAVGGAVAHNSISLIIPCHRVIASDGSLTGYAAGLSRKRFLLQLEGE